MPEGFQNVLKVHFRSCGIYLLMVFHFFRSLHEEVIHLAGSLVVNICRPLYIPGRVSLSNGPSTYELFPFHHDMSQGTSTSSVTLSQSCNFLESTGTSNTLLWDQERGSLRLSSWTPCASKTFATGKRNYKV